MSDCFNHEGDAWDSLLFSEHNDPDESDGGYIGLRIKTCKHCGQDGLTWKAFGNSWRLVGAGGIPHVCPQYTPGTTGAMTKALQYAKERFGMPREQAQCDHAWQATHIDRFSNHVVERRCKKCGLRQQAETVWHDVKDWREGF